MSEPLSPADQELFTRHWTQASRMVADYISALVPNFHEAEDLLQNVAVVLLRMSCCHCWSMFATTCCFASLV